MSGRIQSLIRNHQMMMLFIGGADTFQNFDGLCLRGFIHLNRLEAALQRSIGFDVLAIFIQGRGADHLKLAARQGRLENVGRVHG